MQQSSLPLSATRDNEWQATGLQSAGAATGLQSAGAATGLSAGAATGLSAGAATGLIAGAATGHAQKWSVVSPHSPDAPRHLAHILLLCGAGNADTS